LILSEDRQRLNLKALLEFGELLSQIIIAEILKHPNQKEQLAVWIYFLEIAQILHSFNNFFALETVLGALQSSACRKLKVMNEMLNKQHEDKIQILEKLKKIMFDNQVYTDTVQNIKDPMIPRFSVGGLVELTRLEEVSPTFIQDPNSSSKTWINWSKMTAIAKLIMNMKRFNWDTWESPKYPFEKDSDIQQTILNCDRWVNESANCRIAEFRNTYAERIAKQEAGAGNTEEEVTLTYDTLVYSETHDLWKPKYNELTRRDWKLIIAASSAQQMDLRPGDTIKCSEDSGPGLYIYRLETGLVSIQVGDKDRPYILHGPNCLGEFNVVLPDEPINSQFVVKDNNNATLYKIDVTKLNYLCARDPELSRKFHYYLTWKLSKRKKRILEGNQMRQSRDVPMSEVVKKGVLLPEEIKDQEVISPSKPKEEVTSN